MSRTSEFLVELMRRKVIGAIVMYGAVAWLTIEMITVLVPVFEGPNWLVRTGVVLVMLGFPVAVVVSWWFDFNPRTLRLEASLDPAPTREGAPATGSALAHRLRFEPPAYGAAGTVVATKPPAQRDPGAARVEVQRPQDPVTAASRARSRHTARAAALAVLAMVLIGVPAIFWGRQLISSTSADFATIAVLPFVDTSPDGDNEYFADGLTDELISTLAQVGGLRVAARTSSFAYKGTSTPIRQVGDELAVRVVLTGSIRQEGDQLRIHAQLVNAADGYNLWAMSYERSAQEIFTVQADIVGAVMQQLRIADSTRPTELVRARTDNVEAYHQYLRGRYLWHRRDDPQRREENLRRSLDHFQGALAADPDFALAHAGSADSYASLAGHMPSDEALSHAKAAALRAIGTDESLAEGHVALARILVFREWDWAGAGRAYRRAIELSPSYATARQWYGMYLLHLGHGDDALREIRLAQRLDPLSISVNLDVGRALYYTRSYDEAIVQWRNTLQLDPHSADARLHLGLTYLEKGMFQEARAEFEHWSEIRREAPTALLAYANAAAGNRMEAQRLLDKLLSEAQQQRAPAAALALIYGQLGDEDSAFYWLERAVEERSSFLLFVKVSPRMDRLRADPRYRNLLHRIGLDS
jgi:TolB-like protein/Tfp pilus assembly protein PilF